MTKPLELMRTSGQIVYIIFERNFTEKGFEVSSHFPMKLGLPGRDSLQDVHKDLILFALGIILGRSNLPKDTVHNAVGAKNNPSKILMFFIVFQSFAK